MKKFFLRYSLISLLLVILLGLWDCIPRFSRGENISKDIGFHLPSYSVNEDGGTGHGHRWLTITLDTPLPEHIIENIKNEKNGWEKSGENKFKTPIYSLNINKGTETMHCSINLENNVLNIFYDYEIQYDDAGVMTFLFAMFLISLGVLIFIFMASVRAIRSLIEKSRTNR